MTMGKELTMTNGDVRDADRPCTECDTPSLPPSYRYCPYCGEELDQ